MARPFTAREPAAASVLVDDARTRVTRYDFEPGAETGWHVHHMPYVVVPLTECHFLIESAAGETKITQQAGAVYAREKGVEHNVVNGGTKPMSFVEIEFKAG